MVDTSVWIDHLRTGDDALIEFLANSRVLMHPYSLGEIALGALAQRTSALNALRNLQYIETTKLFGLGIGYVDAHLLASVRLTRGVPPDARQET